MREFSGLSVSLYVHFVFPHLKLMAAIRVKWTRSGAEPAAVHISFTNILKSQPEKADPGALKAWDYTCLWGPDNNFKSAGQNLGEKQSKS